MQTKTQLRLIIVMLIVVGLGAAIYKNQVLGFSFFPETKVSVWTIEAKIEFLADGGPVKVVLNGADNTGNMVLLHQETVGEKYLYTKETVEDGTGYNVWNKESAEGKQVIFYRASAYHRGASTAMDPAPAPLIAADQMVFEGAAEEAATLVVKQIKEMGGDNPLTITRSLLSLLNSAEKQGVQLLLQNKKEYGGFMGLSRGLLTRAGVHAVKVKGLLLDADSRSQRLTSLLQIYDHNKWQLIDPKTAELRTNDNFLLWLSGDEPLFEVTGGTDSSISFATNSSKVLASRASIAAGKKSGAMLIDFSIYSLPLAEQNTFKLLLLIPLGALVVVILRNLVGIQTSGTFMPILIALTFLQTSLLWGLALFLVVVSVGLFMRSYLSHLNLLLVPRISAVLVFVIIIFVAISVISLKLDFEKGLQVTFFPMIIISWTIERMSVLWEEEGPRDVFIQGGGSLFTASIVYLVMTNKFLGHLTYAFPELLLVLLAIILIIGSYSGYRLTELRRFEPMTRES
ncbi:MAG: UUP1 family membrane protein [Thermodesulfobacteriota bacterium]|nr:UUP1 family membrane protein [Thermodesulfobacteriota bacterium]